MEPPSNTVVVALLTALLGGSILLDVFEEELPSTGRSSHPWFLVALVLYGGPAGRGHRSQRVTSACAAGRLPPSASWAAAQRTSGRRPVRARPPVRSTVRRSPRPPEVLPRVRRSTGQPAWSMAKASRKPTVVMRPVQVRVRSNASGIMVSAIIVRMAPAATAVMTAMSSGAAPPSSA
jgi:hypothetical protein